jgi:peroxiredoxin
LTEYASHYPAIRAADADVVALSVDDPPRSAALREQLDLEFPILCDTGRVVVRAWDLYNARENGGIAVPAVFVIDPDLRIRYRSVDATAARVRTDAVLEFLRNGARPAGRRTLLPRVGDWTRAIGNAIRRGARVPFD